MREKGVVDLMLALALAYKNIEGTTLEQPIADNDDVWRLNIRIANESVMTMEWNPDDGFVEGFWKSKSFDAALAHVDDIIKSMIS